MGFLLLLAASAARYVVYHGGGAATVGVLALAGVLLAAYALNELGRFAPGARFAVVTVPFLALVFLAPSFAWCAIPLFFLGLRQLPRRAVWPVVGLLTAAVVIARLPRTGSAEPSPATRARRLAGDP